MDDFGSILERDYGLGRTGKGRIGGGGGGSRGSKNGAGPKFDSSARFSDSFGRTKFGNRKNDLSGSFRSSWIEQQQNHHQQQQQQQHQHHSPGYVSRQETYGSSYSVYDEVFSCNVQSTIPVFEDVFRVPSSRMKVSELRDNDIFRGIPSLKKSSRHHPRVTYEDIFGEAAAAAAAAPDHDRRPFPSGDRGDAAGDAGDAAAAGAKIATAASSRTNSGLGTPPRKDPESSPAAPQASEAAAMIKPDVHVQIKPQGSFLRMSTNGRHEAFVEQQQQHQHQASPNDDQFERAWVSVGEVSLTTRPSDVPPPARVAPDRSRASFDETSHHSGSGPPPQRCPPPLSQDQDHNAASNASSSSELLEKALRERSAQAELSIREKVLDWQKHNLAQDQEAERRMINNTSPPSLPSSPSYLTPRSRAETLSKLREERAAVERIAAEVEAAAAEQARVRAERAAMEHVERDARAGLAGKQQQQDKEKPLLRDDQDQDQDHSKAGEQTIAAAACRTRDDGDEEEQKVAETTPVGEEPQAMAIAGSNGNIIVDEDSRSTSSSSPVFREEEARSSTNAEEEAAPPRSGSGLEQQGEKDPSPSLEIKTSPPRVPEVVEAAASSKDQTTDTESILSIDSFTTNQASASTPGSSRNAAAGTTASTALASAAAAGGGGGLSSKEEAAPETPERIESTVRDDEKSNKSSDVSAEDRGGGGGGGGSSSDQEKKMLLLEEQRKREQQQLLEEARRARERSLVARITAEVRERAALEAKAKAEKAAMDRSKSIDQQQQRRTRPRLKEQSSSIEVAAKELEDRAASSSSTTSTTIPKGGGSSSSSTRVSLRQQLEKERLARIAADTAATAPAAASSDDPAARDGSPQPQSLDHRRREQQQQQSAKKMREERTLVERMRAEARERAAMAKMEREREERERERLERINAARMRERERMEKLEKEREREWERMAREMEREREIEREKDRIGMEQKAAKERAEAEAEVAAAAERLKMERAAVERATAEARARAERAAYDTAAASKTAAPPRPTSVPKQRFGNSASMPATGNQAENGGIRRTTSSANLESDRSTSSNFSREDFKELKGETPERRKARLERYQRTLNRAAQALAQKNKRDLELQSEQAERQRLAERLDSDIRRWSVGKDGNIRALLSTLQYVLWPESGWKQVTLTELISPTAVKKSYRRATLCVHPDKMQQKHASVQQKYIAEKVFHILQVAWNKFNSQETL